MLIFRSVYFYVWIVFVEMDLGCIMARASDGTVATFIGRSWRYFGWIHFELWSWGQVLFFEVQDLRQCWNVLLFLSFLLSSLDKHREAESLRRHDSGRARVSVSCTRRHMGGLERLMIVKKDSQTAQKLWVTQAAADRPGPAPPHRNALKNRPLTFWLLLSLRRSAATFRSTFRPFRPQEDRNAERVADLVLWNRADQRKAPVFCWDVEMKTTAAPFYRSEFIYRRNSPETMEEKIQKLPGESFTLQLPRETKINKSKEILRIIKMKETKNKSNTYKNITS